MIIISGHFRGMKLTTTSGSNTRPTKAMVREAVMSSFRNEIQDSVFIDLFAGSGAMGLEALSRGASGCIFVEKHPEAQRTIATNMKELANRASKERTIFEPFKLLKTEVQTSFKWISRHSAKIGAIWADPPYQLQPDWAQEFLSELEPLLRPGTVFIWEVAREAQIGPDFLGRSWQFLKKKSYGETVVLSWELIGTKGSSV